MQSYVYDCSCLFVLIGKINQCAERKLKQLEQILMKETAVGLKFFKKSLPSLHNSLIETNAQLVILYQNHTRQYLIECMITSLQHFLLK